MDQGCRQAAAELLSVKHAADFSKHLAQHSALRERPALNFAEVDFEDSVYLRELRRPVLLTAAGSDFELDEPAVPDSRHSERVFQGQSQMAGQEVGVKNRVVVFFQDHRHKSVPDEQM